MPDQWTYLEIAQELGICGDQLSELLREIDLPAQKTYDENEHGFILAKWEGTDAAEYFAERVNASRVDYANIPYRDYLRTERWRDTRYECLKRAGFRCQLCLSDGDGKPFEAHHRSYRYRGDPVMELQDLVCLCATCHDVVTTNIKVN